MNPWRTAADCLGHCLTLTRRFVHMQVIAGSQRRKGYDWAYSLLGCVDTGRGYAGLLVGTRAWMPLLYTPVYVCTRLTPHRLVYLRSVNICTSRRIVRATLHFGFRPCLKHGSIVRGGVVMAPSISGCGAMRGETEVLAGAACRCTSLYVAVRRC